VLFALPADISVLELEKLAYTHLARLFWRLAKSLATETELPPALPVEWSSKKYSRRVYRDICEIPLDIPKDEFDRRIRAFGGGHFGISPTIHLHGTEFRAVPPASGQAAALAAADN
jgi:methionyl-tRNA formyltransferase